MDEVETYIFRLQTDHEFDWTMDLLWHKWIWGVPCGPTLAMLEENGGSYEPRRKK